MGQNFSHLVIYSRSLRSAQSRKRVLSFATLSFVVICCNDIMTAVRPDDERPNKKYLTLSAQLSHRQRTTINGYRQDGGFVDCFYY
jgi:hypothetical protein